MTNHRLVADIHACLAASQHQDILSLDLRLGLVRRGMDPIDSLFREWGSVQTGDRRYVGENMQTGSDDDPFGTNSVFLPIGGAGGRSQRRNVPILRVRIEVERNDFGRKMYIFSDIKMLNIVLQILDKSRKRWMVGVIEGISRYLASFYLEGGILTGNQRST
jgi:hypothetical protein